MTYTEALIEALQTKELVMSYDRLRGTGLGEVLKAMAQGGLNFEIDKATGRTSEELLKFAEFFNEFIWSRLPPDAFMPMGAGAMTQIMSDEGGLYIMIGGKKIYQQKERGITISTPFQELKRKNDAGY